ncbi:MAG: class IV adenylate cyclase [Chloroflexota bacterium]
MSHTEVEAKIHVADLATIEQRLRDQDAALSAPRVYERNVRYEDAANTLLPTDRVLRLRYDTRARLTYKEPGEPASKGIASRVELEVTVSDFETTDLLLQKLGYHAEWIYEKYRTTYDFLGCEVVLDEMPYGNFIECEGDPAAIEQVLAALNLADAPRLTESYSDLFFRIKAQLGLAFQDLTFENFKAISVPHDIFG